ncbi:MAG TPA: hypothetical protein VFF27_17925 [Bacteroidia bacterium]|jgi:hypothetical protein|nr:hypothetical protein [Bacteroidia bacterium]
MKISTTIFFCVLLIICTLNSKAQQPPNDTTRYKVYRTTPVWKDMIDDTTANYFEVQKAFELFWAGKSLPEDEEEVIGEKGRLRNNMINRIFNSRELKEQELRETYAFDYKRYRRWLIKMEPYVKEDGSIMTPSERLQLWKAHYDELEKSK